MPPLDTVAEETDSKLAITAEVLFLCNLLVLPGLAFALLLMLYLRHARTCNALCRCHLTQTLVASVWAGILLVGINGAILLFGDYDQPWTWVLLIIYFTTVHATLVLLGVVGLAKAQAGKHYHYPLIGAHCNSESSL
jgi:hypothetical protein